MTDDRELLELAAKAAGITLAYQPFTHNKGAGALTAQGRTWSPLTDDGDALRLAVKLGMVLSVVDHPDLLQVEASVFPRGRPGDVQVIEHYTTDPYAATRRAIVRAAAEIGKAMP